MFSMGNWWIYVFKFERVIDTTLTKHVASKHVFLPFACHFGSWRTEMQLKDLHCPAICWAPWVKPLAFHLIPPREVLSDGIEVLHVLLAQCFHKAFSSITQCRNDLQWSCVDDHSKKNAPGFNQSCCCSRACSRCCNRCRASRVSTSKRFRRSSRLPGAFLHHGVLTASNS